MNETTRRYASLIKTYVQGCYKSYFHEAIPGKMDHPFFTAGISYAKQTWDWGSWLATIALKSLPREQVTEYQKGTFQNFLDHVDQDGKTPILLSSEPISWLKEDSNICKPVLSLFALEISNQVGDIEWIRDGYPKLKKLISYYDKNQKDEESGLYFWVDDLAIGFDNDPSVFFRPRKSSAAIYLNSLMHGELSAIAELARRLGYEEDASFYQAKADRLKEDVRRECFDPIDGFFYSADVSLRKVSSEEWLHAGDPRQWHTLPIKITTWAGMLPLWSGLASKEEAAACVKRYQNPDGLWSEFGIRTVAKNEKMYREISSGNPSCQLGPIWMEANYLTYVGLRNYGYDDLADDLAEKTILVMGKNLESQGGFFEYYHSLTGEGIRGKGMLGWNMLVLRMIQDLEERESR